MRPPSKGNAGIRLKIDHAHVDVGEPLEGHA